MRKLFFVLIFIFTFSMFFLNAPRLRSGQAEEVEITTYYPAPEGVYGELTSKVYYDYDDPAYQAGSADYFLDPYPPPEDPRALTVAGDVGIGISSPQASLHIKGYSPRIRLERISSAMPTWASIMFAHEVATGSGVDAQISVGITGGDEQDFLIQNRVYGKKIVFQTCNNPSAPEFTEVMNITSDSRVGIGTPSPGAALEVKGDIYLSSDAAHSISIPNGSLGRSLTIKAGSTMGIAGSAGSLHLIGGDSLEMGGGNVYLYGGNNTFGSSYGNVILGHNGSSSVGNVGIGTTSPQGILEVSHDNGTTHDLMVDSTTGNVGIGTTTPGVKLHVDGQISSGTIAPALPTSGRVEVSGPAGEFSLLDRRSTGYNSADRWVIYHDSDVLRFNRVSDKVVFDSSGNVGIGTATPGSYKLYVAGNAYTTGTWGGSDLRLKEDIENLTGVLEKLKGINAVKFNWRTDEFPNRGFSKEKQIGIIAQEVEKEFPELVSTDNDGYKAIAYDKFTAILLEAIKEQQKEIELLKKDIAELKTKH